MCKSEENRKKNFEGDRKGKNKKGLRETETERERTKRILSSEAKRPKTEVRREGVRK
jgi:hypothetical protein